MRPARKNLSPWFSNVSVEKKLRFNETLEFSLERNSLTQWDLSEFTLWWIISTTWAFCADDSSCQAQARLSVSYHWSLSQCPEKFFIKKFCGVQVQPLLCPENKLENFFDSGACGYGFSVGLIFTSENDWNLKRRELFTNYSAFFWANRWSYFACREIYWNAFRRLVGVATWSRYTVSDRA